MDDELEKLEAEIALLESRYQDIQTKLWPLQSRVAELKIRQMIDSGVLSKIKWRAERSARSETAGKILVYLEDTGRDYGPPELQKLFHGYHDMIYVDDNTLRTDDGDVTFYTKNATLPETLEAVKRYHLDVNWGPVLALKQEAQAIIETLEIIENADG